MIAKSASPTGETCRAFARTARAGASAAIAAAIAIASPAHAISLQRAESELLTNNVDVALAKAAIDGAEANVTIAAQPPNPTLSASTAQYSPIGGLGAGRPHDKQLDTIVGITVPIERGGKAALKRDQALGQLDGARHDLRDVRRQQRLQLAQAYYDLKLAEERRAIAGRTWDIALQALAAADKRVNAGDLAPIDRHRLSVEALRGANEVISVDADIRDKRVALAVVMGRGAQGQPTESRHTDRAHELRVDDLVADDPWPSASIDDAATPVLVDAIRARADVAAAEARVAAADAGRAVAKSLRVRDVTVGAQVERQPSNAPGLMFGVNVSIPLFVRYGYEGEIARAEADYASALIARQKTVVQAEAEAAKARSQLEGARQRLRAFESDIRPAAKRALDAIEFAYARGASNLTDVLDARRTWHATELDLAVARADHARAIVAWRAATQWEALDAPENKP